MGVSSAVSGRWSSVSVYILASLARHHSPRGLGRTAKVMLDDRTIASAPNAASGTPAPTPKPIGRALFRAFLPCLLWPPLTVLLERLLAFSAISRLWPVPVVIASVILYPACFTKSSPAFRAFMALFIGAALYCDAWALWVGIMLFALKPQLSG